MSETHQAAAPRPSVIPALPPIRPALTTRAARAAAAGRAAHGRYDGRKASMPAGGRLASTPQADLRIKVERELVGVRDKLRAARIAAGQVAGLKTRFRTLEPGAARDKVGGQIATAIAAGNTIPQLQRREAELLPILGEDAAGPLAVAAVVDPMGDGELRILLDLDTPGGEATGAFELAAQIRKANATKPVTAFVNGMAASAGYLIASGAGRIVSVPSGLTGSIGVVMFHADYSRALEKAGITPTLIHAGKNKVDGNPYAPLSAATKARLQAEVDGMREDFVKAVAAGRGGRMNAKAARDTEAAIFTGREAKAIGLVDELATFDALYDELKRGSARTIAQPGAGRSSMEDIAQARVQAMVEERARIRAILTAPEAKGQEKLAFGLALDTMTDAPFAIAAMKAARQKGQASTSAFIDYEAIYARSNGKPATSVPASDAPGDRIDADAIYARLNAKGPEAGDRQAPDAGIDADAIYASRHI